MTYDMNSYYLHSLLNPEKHNKSAATSKRDEKSPTAAADINGNKGYDDIKNKAAQVTTDQSNNKKEDSDVARNDEISSAVKIGYKKWNRSKVCLVGEGRAGKTATANSIIGLEFKQFSPSTIGINEITCDVKHAYASNDTEEIWIKSDREGNQKELEQAIASIILEERKRRQQENPNNQNNSNLPSLANKSINPFFQFIKNTFVNNSKMTTKISGAGNESSATNPIIAIAPRSKSAAPPVTGFDNKKIMSLLSDKADISGDLKVSVYDYGGQEVFASIHHLFLTKYGVYFIVFNMEWLMNDKNDNGMIAKQCLLFIKFWLNSITMHTYSVKDNSIAPIVLIGTRKDKVSNHNDHVRISQLLFDTFSDSIAWGFVVVNKFGVSANGTTNMFFFPVDNVIGRKDPTIQALLKTINIIMSKSDYAQHEIPLAWLQTVDKLSELTKDKPWLPYDVAVDIAIKTMHHEWNYMIKNGIVSTDLLKLLLSDCPFSVDSVVHLMIKFGLLVPFSFLYNNDNNNNNNGYIVSEYLVPSIIPGMPNTVSHQKEEDWNYVGYFVFTTDPRLSNHDYISQSELQTKGFLPKGLFERFVCKAVAWSQYSSLSTSSSTSHSQIYQDAMISYFGSQRFRVRSLYDLNCVEISTKGVNPLSVMNRAYDLIATLTQESMKNLHCIKAVKYDCHNGRQVSSSSLAGDDSVVMIPLSRLAEIASDDLNSPPLFLPGRKSLSKGEILSLYGSWIKLRGPKAIYDDFISYRWGYHDSRFAKVLFDLISNYYNIDVSQHRSVEVFLDVDRLEDGTNFQKSFITSLINSYVFTPIISKDALVRIVSHKPTEIDNVLVEWITAMECLHINNKRNNNDGVVKLERIFPIMLGSVSDDGKIIGNLFDDSVLNALPVDIIPTSSVNKVMELMALNQLQPRTNITQRTLKSFLDELKNFLGYGAWEGINHRSKSVVEICADKIVDVIQQVITAKGVNNNNIDTSSINNTTAVTAGSNSTLNIISPSIQFDIKDWLVNKKLTAYYDQFIACGIDEKLHLLELKSVANDDLSTLKAYLNEIGVDMKPMHAITFFNALKKLD
eukprot:gene4743-6654_t